MSRIFDALQRSESELAGAQLAALTSATDLLQRAEDRVASAGELDSLVGDSEAGGISSGSTPSALKSPLREVSGEESFSKSESPQADALRQGFNQIRSVPVSLSPQSRLVSVTERDSPAAEAFRLLGVRLRHLRRDRPLKKVLITSTAPQEGKSFAATNLACTIASGTRQRVLLLDGDLRRPSLTQIFGLGSIPGVSEWLRGEGNLTSSIRYLEAPAIWILPAGCPPGNPLELIQSAKLGTMMEELTASFDWIIIDSPPVLPLGDTSVWARLADGILLVTRQGTTEKRKLQRGLDALEPGKVVGALLNSFTGVTEKDYYYYRHAPVNSQPTDDSAN